MLQVPNLRFHKFQICDAASPKAAIQQIGDIYTRIQYTFMCAEMGISTPDLVGFVLLQTDY